MSWERILVIDILIQAAIFRLISGGNRNAMLFDHFLTPHPRGGLGGLAAASAEGENVFSVRRRRENTFSPSAEATEAAEAAARTGTVLVIKMPA